MANTVRVRFVATHGAFKAGEEHEFVPGALSAYGDAIEVLTPPASEGTSPDGTVEYDGSLVAKMETTVKELRLQLTDTQSKLAEAKARIAELEEVVAGYTADADLPAKPAGQVSNLDTATETPTDVSPEPEAVDTPAEPVDAIDTTEPAPEAATPAASEVAAISEEPVASEIAASRAEEPAKADGAADGTPSDSQPAESQSAAWEALPVASLNIPSSLKGLLMKQGFTTAGQVAAGLDDGRVLVIDGIGEKKAADLRQHLADLAAS